ncbi:hypothetical protein GRI44_11505 [Altererythrobacter confluentis]|uniref:Sulfotransferase n=1 Tax=Allopontixanthobacter confluentis TaxID=1849021 RepID=A0A6L7GIH3_9SPHN|nr:sulfotransferase [Allopontixanthobacter confluentis]MXP15375.1 hypothetical protein [Allopontixanthobacter confluentis]
MGALRWHYNRIKSYIGRPRMIMQQHAVVVSDHDACPHPLFVLGAHRSGTSLLRRMLNSHPEIACPPESFFIAHYAAMLDDDLVQAGYDGLGYDADAMRDDLARKASELHEAFRIAQGKAIWADKTPQYLGCADAIDRLFGHRPKYLLIYRHPCDIVHSLHQRGWKQNDIADPFEAQLVYVQQSIARLNAFHAAHGARAARFDYRELCENPQQTLTAAMAHIGLAFDPAMLDFGSKEHNFGLEDPVVRGKSRIEASHGAWRSWTKGQKQRAVAAFGEHALDDVYWNFSADAERTPAEDAGRG